MLVQFTPDQFSVLTAGFTIGDPTEAFEPDEMPVPAETVAQLRFMLVTATDNSLDLTVDSANVLKACFTVGVEDNADFDDESYYAILGKLNQITAH